jgi:hypothetical protein
MPGRNGYTVWECYILSFQQAGFILFVRMRSLSLGCLLVCLSCGKPLPELKGIELEVWMADKNGCSGARATSIEPLKKQKADLLGLSEMEIVQVLGKPDRNELYKRNQKFYYYYLQPAPECEQHPDNALRLAIRFNAMGLAKEISVE